MLQAVIVALGNGGITPLFVIDFTNFAYIVFEQGKNIIKALCFSIEYRFKTISKNFADNYKIAYKITKSLTCYIPLVERS